MFVTSDLNSSPMLRLVPEDAELPDQLHRVGGELMAILKDSERPISDRVRAALLLGRLKYVLAIPLLVENVSLVDPTGRETATDWDYIPKYPCAVALAAFTSCTSIDLAHRIADAKDADEVRRWKRGILDADALRGVITHLRGMAVEEADEPRRSLLHSRVKILVADDDAVATSVPPRFPVAWLVLPVVLIAGYAIGRWNRRTALTGSSTGVNQVSA